MWDRASSSSGKPVSILDGSSTSWGSLATWPKDVLPLRCGTLRWSSSNSPNPVKSNQSHLHKGIGIYKWIPNSLSQVALYLSSVKYSILCCFNVVAGLWSLACFRRRMRLTQTAASSHVLGSNWKLPPHVFYKHYYSYIIYIVQYLYITIVSSSENILPITQIGWSPTSLYTIHTPRPAGAAESPPSEMPCGQRVGKCGS